jgi:hypothetical protein
MDEIEMGKTYRTRDGASVRILCTDRQFYAFPVLALASREWGEEVLSFTKYGTGIATSTSGSGGNKDDLIEVTPWDDVEVDTKIYVRKDESFTWLPRHFCRYDRATRRVYAFENGSTSFTSSSTWGWRDAKLA